MSTVYTLNGKVLKNVATDKWLKKPDVDPYNPLGLPAGVMRVKMTDGWSASGYDSSSLEFTQVSSSPNIWDVKVKSGSGINHWSFSMNLLEFMGFNPEGVTGYGSNIGSILASVSIRIGAMRLAEITTINTMAYPLKPSIEEIGPLSLPNVVSLSGLCSSKVNLRYAALTDLNKLEDCTGMFSGCTSLTSMPILTGIERLTSVGGMFSGCTNIESGILDMYSRLSNISSITVHSGTFSNCGSDTVTGTAELAQIPSDWK